MTKFFGFFPKKSKIKSVYSPGFKYLVVKYLKYQKLNVIKSK